MQQQYQQQVQQPAQQQHYPQHSVPHAATSTPQQAHAYPVQAVRRLIQYFDLLEYTVLITFLSAHCSPEQPMHHRKW